MFNQLSYTTTLIELKSNDNALSYGTGFYYLTKWDGVDTVFLVTNYHVLTGNSPDERQNEPQGDSITFYYHMDESDPCPVVRLKVPLFTNQHFQTWLEHPNKKVDIAMIPITFSLPVEPFWKLITKELTETDIEINTPDSVTLIGYPKSFLDEKNALPIYKSGNIASEFNINFNGDPCFLIDISAFAGNSGSPVFSIQKNAQIISKEIIMKVSGSSVKFLGIYSAGIEHNGHLLPIFGIRNEQKSLITSLDMQLGVVWKAYLLQEIVDTNKRIKYDKVANDLVQTKNFQFQVSRGFKLVQH